MTFPAQSQELTDLLAADQAEKRELGRMYFDAGDPAAYAAVQATFATNTRARVSRMLQILNEIHEPSISNIGTDGAQAVSVLALHSTADTLRTVLAAFMALYNRNPEDTYYQAIPSMTDYLLILERKPQQFGTQWLFDADKMPFFTNGSRLCPCR